MHHQFRYTLLFIVLALFGFTSLGYSQDFIEQPNGKPSFLDVGFSTFLVILVALAILAVLVFLGFQMFRKQGMFDETTQTLERNLNQLKQELSRTLDSIQNASRNNANRLKETESRQSSILHRQENIQSDLAQTKVRINNIDVTLEDLKSDMEMDDGTTHALIDYQQEAEKAVRDAQASVSKLARAYREGEPIDFVDIETPTPSQKVVLILNWITRNLQTWITELEQTGPANPDLIQTLGYAEQTIKDKLKTIRGEAFPSLTPLDIETKVSTNTEFNEIHDQCRVYIARFEGILFGYQLGCTIDAAEYNQFIPQFIRDQLFNCIAGFVQFDQMPEQLDKFLELVGYEIIPIEIGKTKVDSRVHDIQESRQIGVEPGTIVEVILPGLQRKMDGEVVQESVVIRGE